MHVIVSGENNINLTSGRTKLHIAVNGYPKIKYIKALIKALLKINMVIYI